MNMLAARSDQIYSVARAVAGFLFLAHGVQKLFGGTREPWAEMRAGVALLSFPFGRGGSRSSW